jgi:DNA-binding response OmpR family regulator
MWVLVVGSEKLAERPEGGVAVLRELGCTVRHADLWDALSATELSGQRPPAAVLIEALDHVEAARSVLDSLRNAPALAGTPVLCAVTVAGLSRLTPEDGFDDVVLVPYLPVELYVRIRRADYRKSEFTREGTLKLGPLVVDCAAHEAKIDGRPLVLTAQEFALLEFLLKNRGRVYTRQQLLERVWDVDYYGGSRTVDIHVRRLRMKLEGVAESLETVRGVGYKMRAP